MLDSFVKGGREHGIISATHMLTACSQAVRDKVAELPDDVRELAYVAAALFNELAAARAALTEANATLITNNLNPVEDSNA